MNSNPTGRLRKNVAEVAHDVATMAELQTKLFLVDLKACQTRVVVAVVLAVVALLIFLGCVPVGLAALGLLLSESVGWPLSAGLGCMAGGGVLISVILLVVAWLRLRSTFTALQRSKEELQRNLTWLKTVLRNDHPAKTTHPR